MQVNEGPANHGVVIPFDLIEVLRLETRLGSQKHIEGAPVGKILGLRRADVKTDPPRDEQGHAWKDQSA